MNHMNHGAMNHSAMGHDMMNHGGMNHGNMDHGNMDHGSMDHGSMDHGSMDHGSMDHRSMDHSLMGVGMDMGMDMNHTMMKMYFHVGSEETILFKFWRTENAGALVGSCLILFVVAMLYEGLKVLREELLYKAHIQMQGVPQSLSTQGLFKVNADVRWD
jgi:hypothetical protein